MVSRIGPMELVIEDDPKDFLAELVQVRQRIDRLLSQNLDSEQLRELGIVLQTQTEAVLWGLTELKRMGHRS